MHDIRLRPAVDMNMGPVYSENGQLFRDYRFQTADGQTYIVAIPATNLRKD
jgi:hypothetical protein